MKADQFLGALRKQPFRPFKIYTSSGQAYDVPHPEQASVSPTGRTVSVFIKEDTALLDMEAITEIVAAASAGRKKP